MGFIVPLLGGALLAPGLTAEPKSADLSGFLEFSECRKLATLLLSSRGTNHITTTFACAACAVGERF